MFLSVLQWHSYVHSAGCRMAQPELINIKESIKNHILAGVNKKSGTLSLVCVCVSAHLIAVCFCVN